MWDSVWSYARVHLGLTDEQFFSLQPRQLRLLGDRKKELFRAAEYSTALLCSVVVNWGFCRPKEPVSVKAFMSSVDNDKPQKKTRMSPKNRQQVADGLRSWVASHNAGTGKK